MEQHPVPQNVTTFQFRLIGDMTLKQFGYLVVGAVLAYLAYRLPLPFLLNWPLAILFVLGGFGLAFVPVEERPMDVWLFSFVKSIYSPTQFVWQKRTRSLATNSQLSTKKVAPDDIPKAPPTPSTTIGWPVVLPGSPPPQTTGPTTPFVSPVVKLEEKIQAAVRADQELADRRFAQLQKQLEDAQAERQRLEKELAILKRRLAAFSAGPSPLPNAPFSFPAAPRPTTLPTPTATEPVAAPTVPGQPSGYRLVPQTTAQSVGLPRLTTFPNVITGVVKDNVGGLLPGILITVRDKDGVPLRALKTNKLGQFAASTPLSDGSFIIEAEDPRNRFVFGRAELALTGVVLPPLEITAKSQKEVSRSELAKQIFGQPV